MGPARREKQSLVRDYRFPEQETRLKPGQSPTAPLTDSFVALTLDALDRRARTATVRIGAGRGIDLPDRLSLHPAAPIDTRRLAAAVRDVIADQCGPRRHSALDDLRARRPPRLEGATRRPTSSPAAIRSAARCRRSWRCRRPCCRSRAHPAPARPAPPRAPSSNVRPLLTHAPAEMAPGAWLLPAPCKANVPWARMENIAAPRLPPAKISHPWQQRRFLVKHPRWELSALVAHARTCPGAQGETCVPTGMDFKLLRTLDICLRYLNSNGRASGTLVVRSDHLKQ